MTTRKSAATFVVLASAFLSPPARAALSTANDLSSSELSSQPVDEGCCLEGGVDTGRTAPVFEQDPASQPGTQAMLVCQAQNARDNARGAPLRRGYDYVPISVDDSVGFYVVYSERTPAANQGINGPVGNTAGIYIFDMGPSEILIFGSGYGDHYVATNSARYDVERVTEVVGGCLGYNPSNTLVHFTTPHGHGDHINSEFLKEMQSSGFAIADITYHIADTNIVNGVGGWTTQLRNLFNPLVGGNPPHGYPCGQELTSYDSPAGKIWFVWRGTHHTNGGMDLIMDVRNNPNDRVLIQGSLAGGQCSSPPSGVRWRFKSHGNLRVEYDSAVVRYGCGLNPDASLTVRGGAPTLGRWLTLGIDNPSGTQNPGALPILAMSIQPDPAFPCGRIKPNLGMSGAGEVLISNAAGHRIRPSVRGPVPWAGPGSPAEITLNISNDTALLGLPMFVQGILLDTTPNAPQRRAVTSAFELRFGN